MWPFRTRPSAGSAKLIFNSPESFFKLQCKYGATDIVPGTGVVALVLDATKEFGTPVAVKIEPDGRQMAMLRVASSDGGFVVAASTPSKNGDPIHPGDLVMWVPSVYAEGVAFGMSPKDDRRFAWVGFIRAKIKPETDAKQSWSLICRYD